MGCTSGAGVGDSSHVFSIRVQFRNLRVVVVGMHERGDGVGFLDPAIVLVLQIGLFIPDKILFLPKNPLQIGLILSFLEQIVNVENLRSLTLDTPFSEEVLKEVSSVLLLQAAGSSSEDEALLTQPGRRSLALEELRLYFRPPLMTGGWDNLDFVVLEIPQEPVIDWIFRDPPPSTASSVRNDPDGYATLEGSNFPRLINGRKIKTRDWEKMQERMTVRNEAGGPKDGPTTNRNDAFASPATSYEKSVSSSSPPEKLPDGSLTEDVVVAASAKKSPQQPLDIPNKEEVFRALSMRNADQMFADEYAVKPAPFAENPNVLQESSSVDRKVRRRRSTLFPSLTSFSLALSPTFVESGLRRSLKELDDSTSFQYWDERAPYYSPILRKMEEFFPNLRVVELDFMSENLLLVLDDVIRPWGAGRRVGGGAGGGAAGEQLWGEPPVIPGGGRGGGERALAAAAARIPPPRGGAADPGAGQAAAEIQPLRPPQMNIETRLGEMTFLANIQSFTVRGSLLPVRHVKDRIFSLLLKKLGPGLEVFRFLPEPEMTFVDM